MLTSKQVNKIFERDGYCNWTRQLPKEHVNLYMTRPARRQAKLQCHLIQQGDDPEGAMFPLYGKPVEYYY